MKYKCLILDHDDTIVDSTRTVNFPAFLDSLSKLRPGVTMTCEDYFKYNYKPGFTALCFDILKFTEEEMHIQENNWQWCQSPSRCGHAHWRILQSDQPSKAQPVQHCVIFHAGLLHRVA